MIMKMTATMTGKGKQRPALSSWFERKIAIRKCTRGQNETGQCRCGRAGREVFKNPALSDGRLAQTDEDWPVLCHRRHDRCGGWMLNMPTARRHARGKERILTFSQPPCQNKVRRQLPAIGRRGRASGMSAASISRACAGQHSAAVCRKDWWKRVAVEQRSSRSGGSRGQDKTIAVLFAVWRTQERKGGL